MPSGVYDPKWLACRTPHGIVRGLAFTLSRRSPSHTGRLAEDELLEWLADLPGGRSDATRPDQSHPHRDARDQELRYQDRASRTHATDDIGTYESPTSGERTRT